MQHAKYLSKAARSVLFASATTAAMLASTAASAAEVVRIALPPQSWWPATVAVAAERLKLFDKEGIKAEITFYKGGGPSFEALAAGAADMNCNGAYLVALGQGKGISTKIVATASTKYAGWHLVVPKNSSIKSVSDLAGKKVGISANGSMSDFLALWTSKNKNVPLTRVPVGGGGVVPSLMAGNVDAATLWGPLSFKVLDDGSTRSILNFGEAVEGNLNAGWIATEEMIRTRPQAVQGTLNALYGAVQYLRQNKQYGVDLIAELNDVPKDIAAKEYEASIMSASTDGTIIPQTVERSVELAKAGGLNISSPAADAYITKFKPVPTR